MTDNWYKVLEEGDDDYTYFCRCGERMVDEVEYNREKGTYTCFICESESPDIENIEMGA